MSAYHASCGKYETSRHGGTCAVGTQDRPTTWVGAFPMPNKNKQDTPYSQRHFVCPQSQPEHICTAGSGEFAAATKDIGWSAVRDTSTPYRPPTSGIADRAVWRVKDQCTLGFTWNGWLKRCIVSVSYGTRRQVTVEGRHTVYVLERHCTVHVTVLARLCFTSQHNQKIIAITHTYHSKCLDGLCMGYAQQSGGGWAGYLLVDLADQSRSVRQPSHVYLRRVPRAQVSVVFNNANAPH